MAMHVVSCRGGEWGYRPPCDPHYKLGAGERGWGVWKRLHLPSGSTFPNSHTAGPPGIQISAPVASICDR